MSGPAPRSETPSPRRIIVRGVNWLGDSVMTTPALRRLRERFSQARITLLTPQKLAELWLHHPSVDAAIGIAPGESPWAVARRVKAERAELAVVLPNSPRSALEMWLAGIPERAGVSRPWRNWLLTHVIPTQAGRIPMHKRTVREIKLLTQADLGPDARAQGNRFPSVAMARTAAPTHQIHEYLHLVASLGANVAPLAPLLEVLPEETVTISRKFGLPLAQSANPTILGLNPGAEYGPAKRWPAERFIAVARQVHQRTHCTCVIFGAASDVPLAATIESALRPSPSTRDSRPSVLNLAGQTTLRELMLLLKSCRALLTNDSGPMHVAAALGTPVVVPFGSTSPELTGPGLPGDTLHNALQARAPCSPCFRRTCPIDFRCMTGISVESVVQATLKAMAVSVG